MNSHDRAKLEELVCRGIPSNGIIESPRRRRFVSPRECLRRGASDTTLTFHNRYLESTPFSAACIWQTRALEQHGRVDLGKPGRARAEAETLRALSSERLRLGPLGDRLSDLHLFADILMVATSNHRCLVDFAATAMPWAIIEARKKMRSWKRLFLDSARCRGTA